MDIKVGSTDKSVVIRIVDDTDGKPETGVVAATAGLAFNYRREGGLLVNIAGLSDLALLTSAHTDGGLLHIGHGYYRIDVPDAAFAAGSDGVLIEGTATGMVVIGQYIQLVGYDPRTELTAAVLTVAGGAAQPGDEMDLVNAPNAVAVAAIQAGLAVPGDTMALTNAAIDAIYEEPLAPHDAVAGSGAEAWADAAACGLGADGPIRTYTVTNSITGLPEAGVYVRVTTDVAGLNTIRAGYTDVFGNFYPRLIAGTYYFWCTKVGFGEVQADMEVFV